MFSDTRLFFREYIRHFKSTGSISPSSRWLARSLSRYVPGNGRPRRVLEVGPGTGAVTGSIIDRLGPADSLDLVELNDAFVARLRERLQVDHRFSVAADRTRVLHQRLEDLPRDQKYDVIISGLPLNNFSVANVEQILAILVDLTAPEGTISFFEYIFIRSARAVISGRAERERLRGIGSALTALLGPAEIRRDWIWPNVPPAWVHHVRPKPT